MKTNVRVQYSGTYTYEGAKSIRITPEKELSRAVMSCLLWEKQFYESGEDIADRIAKLVAQVRPDICNTIAQYARSEMKLRHAPLWIAVAMAKLPEHKKYVSSLLQEIIQRPAELTEALSLYWKGGKTPISAQFKKGLAKAFTKFNAHQLAKYDRKDAVKLKDVLFLSHAKPKDDDQAATWKQLIAGTLASPDTWEVELSASPDKLKSWTRLLTENKLGALALVRNLRNMVQAQVPESLVRRALESCDPSKLFPHQLIAAAKHAPRFEPELENLFLRLTTELPKLGGRTIILVDVSGSMNDQLSGKSEMTRLDAACGLAMIAREVFEQVAILSFTTSLVEVPARRGFALRDAILASQPRGGTELGGAIRACVQQIEFERMIVITDEQSADAVYAPKAKNYMMNVGSYENAIGYGDWVRIDGWSEACVNYITQHEKFSGDN